MKAPKLNKFMVGMIVAVVAIAAYYIIFVMLGTRSEIKSKNKDLETLIKKLEFIKINEEFPSHPRLDRADETRKGMTTQLHQLIDFFQQYDVDLEAWITETEQAPSAGRFQAAYSEFETQLNQRVKDKLGPAGLGYGDGAESGAFGPAPNPGAFVWEPLNPDREGHQALLNKRCRIQERITTAITAVNTGNTSPLPLSRLEEVYFPGQTAPRKGGSAATPIIPGFPPGSATKFAFEALPEVTFPAVESDEPANTRPAETHTLGKVIPVCIIVRLEYSYAYKFIGRLLDIDSEPRMLVRIRGMRLEVVEPMDETSTIRYNQGEKKPDYDPNSEFSKKSYQPVRMLLTLDILDFDSSVLERLKK